jgi:RNA polymerase sigma-70 factor (ECF subfamily)
MTVGHDATLIERFQSGDRLAFEPLVRTYQDRIYTLCRYMLRNELDAQEAAQEVFLKAYRSPAPLHSQSLLLHLAVLDRGQYLPGS